MFNFRIKKQTKKDKKPASFRRIGLLIIVSVISMTSLNLGSLQQANAAPINQPQKSDVAIQKLLLQRFLGACINNAPLSGGILFDNGYRITGAGPANSGDWFNSTSDKLPLSPYFLDTRINTWSSTDDASKNYRKMGLGHCGDDRTIRLALDTLGLSGVDVLCRVGFVRVDGSPCKEGNGDFKYGSDRGAAYANYKREFPEPAIDDAGWYWFYRKVFELTCGYEKMSTPVSKEVAESSSDFGYTLTYVTDTKPNFKESQYFIGLEKRSTGISTRLNPGGGINAVQQTCAEIADKINSFGDRYAASLAAASPEDLEEIVNQPPVAPPNGDGGAGQSACVVEGLGWIVCPVLNFTAGIVDAAYGWVSSLLEIKPLVTAGDTQGIYNGWIIMRNIANIAFVIAFLFIIFSQLTGVGVSNYGVKKMLPRIVIAAILVNISFWICAIAVDLSNILGASMNQVFDAIGRTIPTKPNTIDWDSGEGWTKITGIILATGTVATVTYFAGLSALIPALLAAVVAIVTVFLVLTLRQALIVLLIVVAPLAFVAYLLPNTEGWFKSWQKLFMTLLLMYPIIATVFGASALASLIVMNSSNDTIIQIMGGCIAIIPLAITPLILKTAGGLLNRFAGIVNNTEKGPVDRLRKVGANYREGRTNLRNAQALSGQNQLGRGAFVRWRTRRGAVSEGRKSAANRAGSEYVAETIQENSGFQNSVAGGTLVNQAGGEAMERALANSINVKLKLEADEVAAAKAVIEHANLSGSERQTLALSGTVTATDGKVYGSKTMQKAAIQEQMRTGSMEQIHTIIEASGSKDPKAGLYDFRQAISQGVASNGIASRNPALGGKTIDLIAQGSIQSRDDLDKVTVGAVKEGKFNAESVAGMHDDARERAIKAVVASGDISAKTALKQAATDIGSSNELSSKIAGNTRAAQQVNSMKVL